MSQETKNGKVVCFKCGGKIHIIPEGYAECRDCGWLFTLKEIEEGR